MSFVLVENGQMSINVGIVFNLLPVQFLCSRMKGNKGHTLNELGYVSAKMYGQ